MSQFITTGLEPFLTISTMEWQVGSHGSWRGTVRGGIDLSEIIHSFILLFIPFHSTRSYRGAVLCEKVVLTEAFTCAILASLIDIDHFLEARSLNITVSPLPHSHPWSICLLSRMRYHSSLVHSFTAPHSCFSSQLSCFSFRLFCLSFRLFCFLSDHQSISTGSIPSVSSLSSHGQLTISGMDSEEDSSSVPLDPHHPSTMAFIYSLSHFFPYWQCTCMKWQVL